MVQPGPTELGSIFVDENSSTISESGLGLGGGGSTHGSCPGSEHAGPAQSFLDFALVSQV